MNPKTAFTPAAISETPKLKRYDASTLDDATSVTKSDHDIPAVRINAAESGMRTIRPRYASVNPSDKLKPGKIERDLERSAMKRGRKTRWRTDRRGPELFLFVDLLENA